MPVTSGTTSSTSMGGGSSKSDSPGSGGQRGAGSNTGPGSGRPGTTSSASSKSTSSSSSTAKSSTPSGSSTTPAKTTSPSTSTPKSTSGGLTSQNAIDKAKAAATAYGGAQQSMKSPAAKAATQAAGSKAAAPSAKVQDPSRVTTDGIVSKSAALDDGFYHSFQKSLPGQTNPTQFDKTIRPTGMVNAAHVPMDTFSKSYNPNSLTPGAQKLHQAIVDNAFRERQPVDFFSGKAPRAAGTKQHPIGEAIDIRLRNPTTGNFLGAETIGAFAANPIGNVNPRRGRTPEVASAIQKTIGPDYREFARGVLGSFMDNPDVYGDFNNQRWGGSFGGRFGKDYMHFDEGQVTPAVSADQASLRREAALHQNPAAPASSSAFASTDPTFSNPGAVASATRAPAVPASQRPSPTVGYGASAAPAHVVQASAAPAGAPLDPNSPVGRLVDSIVGSIKSGYHTVADALSRPAPTQTASLSPSQQPTMTPAPSVPVRTGQLTNPMYRDPAAQANAVRASVAMGLGARPSQPAAVASAAPQRAPTEINIPGYPEQVAPSQQGQWGRSVAPSQQGEWGPDENFTQAAGQPQNLGELKNRGKYETARAIDGAKALPGKLADAILNGDFRAYTGSENDKHSYADREQLPDKGRRRVGKSLSSATQQAALVTLLMKLIQQQQAGNPQADLVNSTFV